MVSSCCAYFATFNHVFAIFLWKVVFISIVYFLYFGHILNHGEFGNCTANRASTCRSKPVSSQISDCSKRLYMWSSAPREDPNLNLINLHLNRFWAHFNLHVEERVTVFRWNVFTYINKVKFVAILWIGVLYKKSSDPYLSAECAWGHDTYLFIFFRSLTDRFRALFTLKNLGGHEAIDCISKCKFITFNSIKVVCKQMSHKTLGELLTCTWPAISDYLSFVNQQYIYTIPKIQYMTLP